MRDRVVSSTDGLVGSEAPKDYHANASFTEQIILGPLYYTKKQCGEQFASKLFEILCGFHEISHPHKKTIANIISDAETLICLNQSLHPKCAQPSRCPEELSVTELFGESTVRLSQDMCLAEMFQKAVSLSNSNVLTSLSEWVIAETRAQYVDCTWIRLREIPTISQFKTNQISKFGAIFRLVFSLVENIGVPRDENTPSTLSNTESVVSDESVVGDSSTSSFIPQTGDSLLFKSRELVNKHNCAVMDKPLNATAFQTNNQLKEEVCGGTNIALFPLLSQPSSNHNIDEFGISSINSKGVDYNAKSSPTNHSSCILSSFDSNIQDANGNRLNEDNTCSQNTPFTVAIAPSSNNTPFNPLLADEIGWYLQLITHRRHLECSVDNHQDSGLWMFAPLCGECFNFGSMCVLNDTNSAGVSDAHIQLMHLFKRNDVCTASIIRKMREILVDHLGAADHLATHITESRVRLDSILSRTSDRWAPALSELLSSIQ